MDLTGSMSVVEELREHYVAVVGSEPEYHEMRTRSGESVDVFEWPKGTSRMGVHLYAPAGATREVSRHRIEGGRPQEQRHFPQEGGVVSVRKGEPRQIGGIMEGGIVFMVIGAVWFLFRKRIAAYQLSIITEKFKVLPVRDKTEQARGMELLGIFLCSLLFLAGALIVALHMLLA
ncbi:hypothetical protein [Arthrobacter sp. D3-16]